MLHGDESDPGGLEDVERVHERAAHDPEDVLGAVRHQGLDEGLGGRHLGLHIPPFGTAEKCRKGDGNE